MDLLMTFYDNLNVVQGELWTYRFSYYRLENELDRQNMYDQLTYLFDLEDELIEYIEIIEDYFHLNDEMVPALVVPRYLELDEEMTDLQNGIDDDELDEETPGLQDGSDEDEF